MKGYSRSREDFIEILYTKYFAMFTEEDMNWVLWVGEQTTDYLLEGFDDALPDLIQQDNIIYQYNQYRQSWSKKSCTVFSALGAISDLFNYEFSLDEIKKVDDMSYSRGRFQDSGWWVQAAVKLVADYWNEHHKDLWEVAYYRVDKWNESVIKNILDKGYTLMTSFNGNYSYIKDYDSDGILNGTKFWAATFGHAINVRKVNWKRCCKDSAAGTEHNIYELEHLLSEITCYSSNAYIYTKVGENKLTEVKRLNEFRTLLLATIEANSKLRHLTKDEKYKNILHEANNQNRQKVKDCEIELAKYM
jgi:hypothetical protein